MIIDGIVAAHSSACATCHTPPSTQTRRSAPKRPVRDGLDLGSRRALAVRRNSLRRKYTNRWPSLLARIDPGGPGARASANQKEKGVGSQGCRVFSHSERDIDVTVVSEKLAWGARGGILRVLEIGCARPGSWYGPHIRPSTGTPTVCLQPAIPRRVAPQQSPLRFTGHRQ